MISYCEIAAVRITCDDDDGVCAFIRITISKIECDFRRMKNHVPLPSSLLTPKIHASQSIKIIWFRFRYDFDSLEIYTILCKVNYSMLLGANTQSSAPPSISNAKPIYHLAWRFKKISIRWRARENEKRHLCSPFNWNATKFDCFQRQWLIVTSGHRDQIQAAPNDDAMSLLFFHYYCVCGRCA